MIRAALMRARPGRSQRPHEGGSVIRFVFNALALASLLFVALLVFSAVLSLAPVLFAFFAGACVLVALLVWALVHSATRTEHPNREVMQERAASASLYPTGEREIWGAPESPFDLKEDK